jgi:glycosyltransferase involved in cell wall biosynthesis
LIFLGQGSDWPVLRELAAALPDAVEFTATVPPAQAAALMRGAVVSVASIRPDAGYSFAFPTKVFASWATGTPVIYAGPGPVHDFLEAHAAEAKAQGAQLGEACDYDVAQVAEALRRALNAAPDADTRRATGGWALRTVSLDSVAVRAVEVVTQAV